jgi:hypothetical protein
LRPVETQLPFRTGLAALAMALLPLTAESATRSSTLSVSLTIVAQCSIQTAPLLQAGDVERLFLAGETTGTVAVRCTRGTPFALAWQRDAGRFNSSIVRFAPFGITPFNPRFEDLLSPDSPLGLTDTPSRLVMPAASQETGPDKAAPITPRTTPPMIVITF